MRTFLLDNWGTILIGAALLGIIAAIVMKLIKDKQKGKNPGCGCGCGECHHLKNCHPK